MTGGATTAGGYARRHLRLACLILGSVVYSLCR